MVKTGSRLIERRELLLCNCVERVAFPNLHLQQTFCRQLAYSRQIRGQGGLEVGVNPGDHAMKPEGSNILCMLPDTGERYSSTPLFADVSADMNEQELKISHSTPSAQLSP
jgi:hypothetical protein